MTIRKTKAARAAAPMFNRLANIRWKVQLFFLILLNPLWIQEWRINRAAGVCLPILNCHGCPAAAAYCPIGVIGDMLNLGLFPWLAIGMFGVVGILLGRLTCGWACPFGFLQDLLAKIPLPKFNPPRWTHLLKYAVLVGMVFIVPILIGTETNWFFCRICPEATLKANGWLLIADGRAISVLRLSFFGGFLLLMLFVERGFCRLICPIGAGLALFNKISFLSIKFKKRWCSECMQCVRQCPISRGPMTDPRDPECIYCMDCFKCTGLKMNFSDDRKSVLSGKTGQR
ncbi:4Fe-4S binding protein [Verrucomicrobiota bacterium]